MNAIRKWYNGIGTRAECSPVIGGLILLVGISVLIYIYRHIIEVALVCTGLAVLAGMAVYTAVAVTVAYRRHVRAQTIQAGPAPSPAPEPEPEPEPRSFADADTLPPRQEDLADLHAASGVNADGSIS